MYKLVFSFLFFLPIISHAEIVEKNADVIWVSGDDLFTYDFSGKNSVYGYDGSSIDEDGLFVFSSEYDFISGALNFNEYEERKLTELDYDFYIDWSPTFFRIDTESDPLYYSDLNFPIPSAKLFSDVVALYDNSFLVSSPPPLLKDTTYYRDALNDNLGSENANIKDTLLSYGSLLVIILILVMGLRKTNKTVSKT